jgi:hypothetical protein
MAPGRPAGGSAADVEFTLPVGAWQGLLDTAHPRGVAQTPDPRAASATVASGSLLVLGAQGCKIAL